VPGARFRAAKRKRSVKPGGKKVRFFDPDATRRFLEATKGGPQNHERDHQGAGIHAGRPSPKQSSIDLTKDGTDG